MYSAVRLSGASIKKNIIIIILSYHIAYTNHISYHIICFLGFPGVKLVKSNSMTFQIFQDPWQPWLVKLLISISICNWSSSTFRQFLKVLRTDIW